MALNITEVRLLNVPLENDYLNTFYFQTREAQTAYFKEKEIAKMDNATYQRKDNVIRYPGQYDDIARCNYVMYKNAAHSNLYVYAFITKLEYVNEGMTLIHIETDVIQTWLFDYVVRASFVEREHVKDDTIGLHTVPERLELGEYITNNVVQDEMLFDKSIILASTVELNNQPIGKKHDPVSGGTYNRVFSGVKYFEITQNQLQAIIEELADAGQSDAIVAIFMAPKNMVNSTTPPSADTENELFSTYPEVQNLVAVEWEFWAKNQSETYISKPNDLNGYIPKNNKLFTYPYQYLLVSNNSGGAAAYKYELFYDSLSNDENACDFRIYSAITPGMSIRLVPCFYDGTDENNEEGLNLGKFPICNWTTDVYTNWLTQNAVNVAVSVGSSLLTVAGGVGMLATGAGAAAGASMIASGVLGVAGSVGEVYAHSLTPPQAEGNINNGDVTFAIGKTTFTAYQKSIKAEYAQIIDEFFTMYGYKVNRVKVPNYAHRKRFWYTKCIDVNIDGNIPQEDMQKIKDCYNRGITFWRTGYQLNNYTADNGIIGEEVTA